MKEKTKENVSLNLEVPKYYNFAKDTFDKWAEKDESKLALFWIDDDGNEKKLTYRELKNRSCKVANMLKDQGIKKGDIIILVTPKIVEWWEIMLAGIRIGAIISPGTKILTEKDIRYRLEFSEAKAVICDSEFSDKIDALGKIDENLKIKIYVGKHNAQKNENAWINYHESIKQYSEDFTAENTMSDEACLLYFTSGTSGMPKMTIHTHSSYPIGHRLTGKYWHDLKENDIMWTITDTGWGKIVWSAFFNCFNYGATVFVHHSKDNNPEKILEILGKYPIDIFCGPPTIYRMFLLKDLSKYKFAKVRRCVSAGEPLHEEANKIWEKHFNMGIYEGYGQTETVCLLCTRPDMKIKAGSMGKPTPGFEVEIVDDDGNILPINEEGNIAVKVKPHRPVGLFKEYLKAPERTQKVFRGDWYYTGDKAYKDEDGYFWFVGRADDIIISSGYRIGPFEVESTLLEHPSVAEVAVVSSPDKIRGEVVKAFIVLAPGFEGSEKLSEELKNHVKNVTAPYKYPRKIEYLKALPKTINGKTKRAELREKEWATK